MRLITSSGQPAVSSGAPAIAAAEHEAWLALAAEVGCPALPRHFADGTATAGAGLVGFAVYG